MHQLRWFRSQQPIKSRCCGRFGVLVLCIKVKKQNIEARISDLCCYASSHCSRSNHGNITKICSAHFIILKNWSLLLGSCYHAGFAKPSLAGQKVAKCVIYFGWSFGWQHMACTIHDDAFTVNQTISHCHTKFYRCHPVRPG